MHLIEFIDGACPINFRVLFINMLYTEEQY